MRIIQLTDLHIGTLDEFPFDIDVRKNFTDCIQQIYKEEFDALVISGDLCYRKPDLEIYRWIHDKIKTIRQPVIIMAGNHDSPEMINSLFYNNRRSKHYFIEHIRQIPFVFLDSSSGRIDAEQLVWFRKTVEQINGEVILFMHHPPCMASVPHMDNKYALQNYRELQDIIFEQKKQVYVFCGHYHLEKSINLKNLHTFITPSTFFQIDDRHEKFKIGTHPAGYRQIDWDGETLLTKVRFPEQKQNDAEL